MADPNVPGPPGFWQLIQTADHHLADIDQAWWAFLADRDQVGAVLVSVARAQATLTLMRGIAVAAADDLGRSPSLSIDQLAEVIDRAPARAEGNP